MTLGQVFGRLAEHGLTVVEIEDTVLGGVDHGGHDNFVEQLRRSFNDLKMSVVDGIERAGIKDTGHGTWVFRAAGAKASVTTVPP